MGGGGGSSKPGSAPQPAPAAAPAPAPKPAPMAPPAAAPAPAPAPQVHAVEANVEEVEEVEEVKEVMPPDFLENFMGKGKYNVGFAGPPGCGKSAFMNDVLGTNVAVSGSTECTLVPTAYELPLSDPRGYFQKFIEQLPQIHKDCVSRKLKSVKLWDLPGAGTRLHPSDTYVVDKGLRFFDFVVVFVGERVLEVDHALVSNLIANKVKFFVCRSKLDIVLNSHLKSKKKELKRSLSSQDKLKFATDEMESIRKKMVDEVCQLAPNFHGHLYLLVALAEVDEDEVNFDTVSCLHEAQIATDRLLLEIISDRHGHDLRKYFNNSLYGHASKAAFNFFSSAFSAPPHVPEAGSSGSGGKDQQAVHSACSLRDALPAFQKKEAVEFERALCQVDVQEAEGAVQSDVPSQAASSGVKQAVRSEGDEPWDMSSGHASKAAFNFFSSAFSAPPHVLEAGSIGSGGEDQKEAVEFENALCQGDVQEAEGAVPADGCPQAASSGVKQAVSSEGDELWDSLSALASDMKPEDSMSQVGVQADIPPQAAISGVQQAVRSEGDEPWDSLSAHMNGEQGYNVIDVVHLPDGDAAQSVLTENMSDISDSRHSWISVSMDNATARCFLPESLFKTEGGYISGRELQKGSHVMAADGIGIVEVVKIDREFSQSIMELRTNYACLRVTPNHRVVVPARSGNRSGSDALARTLEIGDEVLCDAGTVQKLTQVTMMDERAEVLAIAFQPDKAVAVFLPPAAIQTKGVKNTKKRRGGNGKHFEYGTENSVLPDFADTDSDIAANKPTRNAQSAYESYEEAA